MNHVARSGGQNDIKVCSGLIPPELLVVFRTYRSRAASVAALKRQHSAAMTDVIADNQTSIAVAFESKQVCRTTASVNDPSADDEGAVENCNASQLTSAIAGFIFCKGLSFSAVEGEHFLQILKLARLVTKQYRAPSRKVISNDLLNISYNNRLERYMDALSTDSTVFGLSLFGDGATVHGMPLMNILACRHYEPSALLAIVDCKFFFSCCWLFYSYSHSLFCCFRSSLLFFQVRTI
jgi:hypothetical protein